MQEKKQYPSVSVVIPTRNEAKNLYHILPKLPPIVTEVVLVDGHSTDDTIAVAKELYPTIRVLEQTGKGKGDAMRMGFAACTSDIIVMLDADGSADPNEIYRFADALLEGHDFAKGSRFVKGAGSDDLTWLRTLGNYGLCMVVNILFGQAYSDLCYGYNVFWRQCLDYVTLDCTGFEIESQLCLRMLKAKMNIVEVASMEHSRIHGQSNLRTFRDGWRVLKTIFSERYISGVTPKTSNVPFKATPDLASSAKEAVLPSGKNTTENLV
jgi:glycosyltransferase involved in cell wall biosynthesis